MKIPQLDDVVLICSQERTICQPLLDLVVNLSDDSGRSDK